MWEAIKILEFRNSWKSRKPWGQKNIRQQRKRINMCHKGTFRNTCGCFSPNVDPTEGGGRKSSHSLGCSRRPQLYLMKRLPRVILQVAFWLMFFCFVFVCSSVPWSRRCQGPPDFLQSITLRRTMLATPRCALFVRLNAGSTVFQRLLVSATKTSRDMLFRLGHFFELVLMAPQRL